MSENEQALTPIEERTLEFYDDELLAVKMVDGAVYVPVRRLCDNLGLAWPGQYERIQRDEILSEAVKTVRVTRTVIEGGRGGGPADTICLPLDMIPGWLFGVQVSRVREDLRPKLKRYRRECFKVLWDAFKSDILPAAPERRDLTPAEQGLAMAEAVYHLAKQQVIFERLLVEHGARLDVLDSSLEKARETFGEVLQKLRALELRIYGPGEIISEAQAAEVAATVAALAHTLTQNDPAGGNYYQSVWGELRRRYNIATYTRIPAARFGEVIGWLETWLASGQRLPPP
jgi:hypothetical protein